jgi:hypothetical protein
MANLIYVTNVTLDGYIEDEHGDVNLFPLDDVFTAYTDLLRPRAPSSTGVACTKRCPSGRPTPTWLRPPP